MSIRKLCVLIGLILLFPQVAKTQSKDQSFSPQAVIAERSKAIEVNPRDAKAYFKRGNAYYEKAYDEVVSKHIFDTEDIGEWKLTDAEKAMYEPAISDFTKAIELNPRLVNAYVARGVCFGEQHQFERGIADCTKAIRMSPENAIAYYKRGYLYQMKKNYSAAIADYDKALQFDPSFLELIFFKGWAYEALSLKKEALVSFELFIKTATADEWSGYRNRAQGKIDQLKAEIQVQPDSTPAK